MLLAALLLTIHAEAHSLSNVNGKDAKISPELDPKSDKKFFGPPFPADYPDDKRPAVDQAELAKLKGPNQPYPALQSKADYDTDYVKDENSDKGAWKSQMEYDRLRRKLAKEAGDASGAADRAGKEGREADDAQGKADKAAADAAAAQKALDDAKAAEEAAAKKAAEDAAKAGKDGEGDGKDGAADAGAPPSAEELEKLKKRVAEAEENYEKEKKQFEECKAKLEEAKKNVEELKARQAEMEKQLAAETKLWVETKTVRLNLQKSKQEAAHAKKLAADARVNEALALKAEMDKVLADKKALHAKALENVQKKKTSVDQARSDLEKATVTLQKLRGYKPAEPVKSDATKVSFLLSLSAVVAVQLF